MLPFVSEVHIFAAGDPSVGIPSTHITFDLEIDLSETREETRGILREAFAQILDEAVTVVFGDEYTPERY